MLIRNNFVFYWEEEGGGKGVCTERVVTQEGSAEQTGQSVMVGVVGQKGNFRVT